MEESVKIKSETCLAYSIELTDFTTKLSKAKLGEKMETSPLVISWSTFTIGVYLQGENQDAEDHISVFLFNESEWLVKATYKISVTGQVFAQSESSRTFYPRENSKYPGWGFLQCIPHQRCVKKDLLDKNGTLVIKIELQVIDELIPASLLERRNESQELNAKVDSILEKVEGSLPSLQRDLLDVKNMMKMVLAILREVECPLCLKQVKTSSIYQLCSQGHKLCGECHDQVRGRDNNNKRDVCILCNISDFTKPSVLEKVMGTGAAIFNF